jgi:lipopolysaccharide export system protein LptC
MAARRYLNAMLEQVPGTGPDRARLKPATARMSLSANILNAGTLSGRWSERNDQRAPADWIAARRHSRIVRVLRIVLPAVATIVVVWMFISAQRLPGEIGNIDLGEVGLEGTTLTMQNPKLSGFNEDGTSYLVTAAKALQDVTNPRVVTLVSVDGTMTKPDNSTIRVTADDGVFDSDAKHLELTNNIVVRTSENDSAYLDAAKVDLNTGSIVSDKPVRADSKSGSIRANSMEISQRGAHLLFRGKVAVQLRLDGGPVEGKSADKASAGTPDGKVDNEQ